MVVEGNGGKVMFDLDIPKNMWNKDCPENPHLKCIRSPVDLADEKHIQSGLAPNCSGDPTLRFGHVDILTA